MPAKKKPEATVPDETVKALVAEFLRNLKTCRDGFQQIIQVTGDEDLTIEESLVAVRVQATVLRIALDHAIASLEPTAPQ